jgi:hypothetical protein
MTMSEWLLLNAKLAINYYFLLIIYLPTGSLQLEAH